MRLLERLRPPMFSDMLGEEVPHDAFQIQEEPPQSIVERYADNLAAILRVEREREAHFVRQLAVITEELRQTRLVIEQLAPAAETFAREAGQ